MLSIIRSPFNRMRHVLGTGRALENARRDRDESDESERALAVLEARFAQANAA
jgi:hypothetical protein